MQEYFYRYFDTYGEDGCVYLFVHTYPVVKTTPCGVWLYDDCRAKPRFVLREGRKRYALSTKEAAFQSFVKRKEKQCKILRGRLARASDALVFANKCLESGEIPERKSYYEFSDAGWV